MARPSDLRSALGDRRAPRSGWSLRGRIDVRGLTEDVFDEDGNHSTRPLAGSPRQPACDHCGARLTKAYLIRNGDGEAIAVGSECCREFLGMSGMKAIAARIRASGAARKKREQAARAEREKAERIRLAEEAFTADADVYESLRARIPLGAGERRPFGHKSILDDFARQLAADRLLVLSARQVELARRLIAEETEQKASAPAVVAVRRSEGLELTDLAVELVRLREQDGRFGPVLKATLREPSGHLVWLQTGSGTKAAGLLRGLAPGDGVQITRATVSGQSDDRSMTFLRRPVLRAG